MTRIAPSVVTRAVWNGRWPVSRLSSPNAAAPVRGESDLPAAYLLRHLDLAVKHHQQVIGVIGGREQHLPGLDRPHRAVTEQAIELVGGENRVGGGLVLEDAHRDHRPAWAR